MIPNVNEEKFDFANVKAGTLVFVKDTVPCFKPQNLEDKSKKILMSPRHYSGTVNLSGNVVLLTKISIEEKEKDEPFFSGAEARRYTLEVLHEGKLYCCEVDTYSLVKSLDFLHIPERPITDKTDLWLTTYFGVDCNPFRVRKDFRARRGNSLEDLKKYRRRLPRRDDAVKTFYVKEGELCICIGARRSAARRLIIIDFL